MDFGARDIISGLPNALISHILSFLSTKEAAATSVLSKSWRFLFAFVTILDFDDFMYLQPRVDKQLWYAPQKSFMEFVDRVLALQGNDTLNKFSLKCNGEVDLARVTGWIFNVLGRGVQDLDLIFLGSYKPLTSKGFVSTTLVKLKLEHLRFINGVENVFLPKLKTLYLVDLTFEEDEIGFAKLLSGCPVLEELVLMNIGWEVWNFCSVSITTLERLTFFAKDYDMNPISVSFVTPNLSYLEYSDIIADKYPNVIFDSLVEASICLRLTKTQSGKAFFRRGDYFLEEMVGSATSFLMAISNVQFLSLSDYTLKVLAHCCKKAPVFNNLIRLTIESVRAIRHKSFQGLLKNCPNLETLIFKNMHWYKPQESLFSFLASSPVKVLKISMSQYNDDKVIRLFLEKMPRLEQLIVYYNTSYVHHVFELSKKLQRIPRIASPKCKIQVISENLRLSCTLPSSSAKSPAPSKVEYS